MNKLFTKITSLALGAAMMIGVGVAVASNSEAVPVYAAADTYVTMGSGSGSNNVNTWYIDSNKVTVTQNKGSGSTNPNASYVSGTNTRFYVGNVMAFVAATGYKVTGVKITNSTSSSYYGGTYHANTSWESSTSNITSDDTTNLTLTNCASTTSGSTSTIESKSTSGVAAIYVGTTKQSRPSKIEVKYTSSTTSYTTTVNVTGGALSVNNTSTSFTSALTYGYVYLTPDSNHVIPDDPSSAFSVSNATLSSAYDNQDGDVALYLTSVKGNITVTGSFDEKTGTYYSISYTGSNGSLSNTSDVAEGEVLDIYLLPDTHYHLPTSITLTMGGVTQTAGTDYDYDNATGEIQILEVTGNIVISTSCVEDTKFTVTYVKGDHGTGDDYVVSNQYAGSYTLVTFATAGFSADSGYAFKNWSVGGVEYAEGVSITISGDTTITAVYQEVTTYTIVTDASTLKDGTTFVLVGNISSTYYVSNGLNSGHVLLTAKTAATTISNGVESGSTLVSTEAQVLTLEGSTGSFKIKYGDSYLKFTGTSNGNDSFDTEANASTFSASMSGSYILFTCTSSTGSGRVWRLNTGSKDMRNYATSSGVGDVYMFANIPASNELDSVTTSGQTTSFTAGNNFSYGGTLTAHYTLEDDATVTPTSFKLGDSGIDPTSAGESITTSTTLTKTEHDGKYIYVIYTEDDITKYCSYQITVNYAAVTSVVIDTHEAEIGLNETYDYTLVGVTVNTSYADPGYEWIVHANTVGGDYTFDGSGLKSKDTEGTITLWCRSTADNSKYDELVVTVTGDPTAEFTPASVSGYVGKGTSVAFTYGNIDDTSKISVSSNNASVTVGAISASAGEGSVAITFVSAGSATLSISYDGGSALDTVGVTVSADSVTALTWSAPTIKVYSGATTTVSDASSWNVHYTMASGDYGSLVYGEYTLKLGESAIALPHTWDVSDDGKALSIEYGGFASPTTSTVDVTQSLQAVNMPNEGDSYYQLVSTDADLEAGRYLIVSQEDNLAFDGSLATIDAGQNHFSVTINNGVIADDSASSEKYFDLTVSGTAWTITSASGSNVAHSGSKNGMDGSGTNTISISNGVATIAGSGGKELQYNATSGSSNERFRYYTSGGQHSVSLFKLVTEEGEGSTNIANVAGHEAAQKAVVAFAKAMNAAFDNTENCTDGVADAWSTASSAYSSNITNNSSLSTEEKAYAKNLIKYASAQYTDNTDNDYSYCLERAMATYEACIQKHGQTAFMSDVRSVSASSRNTSLSFFDNGNSNTVAIIVVISMISITCIGGFFLRKRKEN